MTDAFNLERFVTAQESVLDQVRRELRDGRKLTHWMWFVFPQLRGLGHSPMALRYGIASLEEAQAYVSHPVLGPRLIECTSLVSRVQGWSAYEIFGNPDDRKFHSSITLFALAKPGPSVFLEALERFFEGRLDQLTLQKLTQH